MSLILPERSFVWYSASDALFCDFQMKSGGVNARPQYRFKVGKRRRLPQRAWARADPSRRPEVCRPAVGRPWRIALRAGGQVSPTVGGRQGHMCYLRAIFADFFAGFLAVFLAAFSSITACAAARRAMGTRKGEQET